MLVYLHNIFSGSKIHFLFLFSALHFSCLNYIFIICGCLSVLLLWLMIVMTDFWGVLIDQWYMLTDLWLSIVFIGHCFVFLATIFLTSLHNVITISVTTSLVTASVHLVFCLPGHSLFSQYAPMFTLGSHVCIYFHCFASGVHVPYILTVFHLPVLHAGQVLTSPFITYLIIIPVQLCLFLAVI